MKAYLIVTGIVFGLITAMHIVRMIMESSHLAKDPLFLLLTAVAAGLSFWAFRLLARYRT